MHKVTSYMKLPDPNKTHGSSEDDEKEALDAEMLERIRLKEEQALEAKRLEEERLQEEERDRMDLEELLLCEDTSVFVKMARRDDLLEFMSSPDISEEHDVELDTSDEGSDSDTIRERAELSQIHQLVQYDLERLEQLTKEFNNIVNLETTRVADYQKISTELAKTINKVQKANMSAKIERLEKEENLRKLIDNEKELKARTVESMMLDIEYAEEEVLHLCLSVCLSLSHYICTKEMS